MKKILKYVIRAIIYALLYGVVFMAWQSGFNMEIILERLIENPPIGASVFFGVFMFIVKDFRKSKEV